MKKILLVYDEKGWIFENHCIEIKNRLSDEYYFDMVDRRQDIPLISKDFDFVYVLDPMLLSRGYPPKEKTIMGLRNQFLYEEHPQGPLGLYESGFPGRCVSLNRCSVLHMVNKRQMGVFKSIVGDKDLLVLCQHGVNTEKLFDKSKYFKRPNNVLTVGAAGRNSSNKSFNIIKTACDKIGAKFTVAEYNGNRLKKEQMPSFYNSLDVLVSVSKSEGENNSLIEAGAMAVPIVASNTGTVSEMIEKDGKNGFVLYNRTVDELASKLEILKNKELREQMGASLYQEVINNWSWRVCINNFRNLFELAYSR